MTALNLLLRRLCYTSLCICFAPIALLHAQDNFKTRLIITDESGSQVSKIDTILPPNTNTDAVLRQLGYDSESIAQAYTHNKARRITVRMEELLDDDFWAKKQAEHRTRMAANMPTTTAQTQQAPANNTITNEQSIAQNWEQEIMRQLPPNAKIEDTPEGKKITSTRTDPDGTVYTETTIIGKPTTSSTHNPNPPNLDWNTQMGKDNAPIPVVIGELPPLPEELRAQPKNQTYKSPPQGAMPKAIQTESHQQTDQYGSKSPNVSVTIDELDMFDHSTLQRKYPQLLNAEPIAITKFAAAPDFAQGYFRFSFTLPDETEYKLEIFDVVGTPIHSQSVMGLLYNQLIPAFHVYKKGTYLLLITQDNKKFTRKINIE